MTEMIDSPEALAIFGLIDAEEYLQLTAHYQDDEEEKYRCELRASKLQGMPSREEFQKQMSLLNNAELQKHYGITHRRLYIWKEALRLIKRYH